MATAPLTISGLAVAAVHAHAIALVAGHGNIYDRTSIYDRTAIYGRASNHFSWSALYPSTLRRWIAPGVADDLSVAGPSLLLTKIAPLLDCSSSSDDL